MLASIAKLSLGSKIAKDNQNRKRQFLPWEKVEKIALILHKKDQVNKSAMDKFVDETKKFIEVFYVDPGAKQPAFADWHCFSKKDASLLGLPKTPVLLELKKRKFDLVINTCSDDELFATALASALQAPLKCSGNKSFNDTDLIIEKTTPYQVMNYLGDVLRYLKMIKV